MAQEVLAKHSGWAKCPSRCFDNVNVVYLKEWKFIVSQLERLEIHSQGAGRALVPLKALGAIFPCLFLALVVADNPCYSLACNWIITASTCVSTSPSPLSAYVWALCPFLTETPLWTQGPDHPHKHSLRQVLLHQPPFFQVSHDVLGFSLTTYGKDLNTFFGQTKTNRETETEVFNLGL